MTTAAEVKLLTLLNVSAVKRPRALDQPGGFRSPAASRAQSESGSSTPRLGNGNEEPQPKRRRSVVFGGEVGPSGSTYGKKPKKKVAIAEEAEGNEAEANGVDGEVAEVNGEAEEDDAEDDADSDDEGEDTFVTHFGASPAVLSDAAVAAAEGDQWETSRVSVQGLGRVVEQRPAGCARASGKARVSLSSSLFYCYPNSSRFLADARLCPPSRPR